MTYLYIFILLGSGAESVSNEGSYTTPRSCQAAANVLELDRRKIKYKCVSNN